MGQTESLQLSRIMPLVRDVVVSSRLPLRLKSISGSVAPKTQDQDVKVPTSSLLGDSEAVPELSEEVNAHIPEFIAGHASG